MPTSKFIQIFTGAGAMICALDDNGKVWIFNHNKQIWDGLPEARNEMGSTKPSTIAMIKKD